MIQVTGLFIYPVKGLRAIALESSELTAKGLAYDRHWMVVMPNGRMVTQRQKPLLATLATELTEQGLKISAPGREPLEITLEAPELRVTDVTLWRDSFMALDEGAEASAWLTQALDSNYPLRLVRMDERIPRPQSKPELLGDETSTGFADAAPFLVTNESSLADLNGALETKGVVPVPMARFRPNIVVSGLPPYREYDSSCLTEEGGRYSIGLKYPSERCVVVTTDQNTGEVDRDNQQPLSTLKEMDTAPGYKGAYFGQNAVLARGQQEIIRVGDNLVLE